MESIRAISSKKRKSPIGAHAAFDRQSQNEQQKGM
jgi:hypothetical protein